MSTLLPQDGAGGGVAGEVGDQGRISPKSWQCLGFME